MNIDLTGRVAIVTGAGAGLGREHALALAKHGACVVVNDLDGDAAAALAGEIEADGGQAMPDRADVTDYGAVEAMVAAATGRWGGVDLLVNNAGILRDRSFAKSDLADFRRIIDVHLMGSVHCTKAVWDGMRERGFGRIIFTTSSSGLYGNFGQSNYSAAKMALVGLMQTLAIEGERSGIRVNCLAPSASTAMTEGLYDADTLRRLGPAAVSPAVVALCADNAPTKAVVLAGAGHFAVAEISMTQGLFLDAGDVAGELSCRWADIADRADSLFPASGGEQHAREVASALSRVPA